MSLTNQDFQNIIGWEGGDEAEVVREEQEKEKSSRREVEEE
jgi:hypothetical protein